mmetsp:Transcript_125267/g.350758  ORF Transcript_125267/g.350758 Transcript_125267/m.350758 type:complete len:241 (-) Transcript_125267:1273-1995(-)
MRPARCNVKSVSVSWLARPTMRSINIARCVESKPGGNRGGTIARPLVPVPSCRCMVCKMLHTMCGGIEDDGIDTGGQCISRMLPQLLLQLLPCMPLCLQSSPSANRSGSCASAGVDASTDGMLVAATAKGGDGAAPAAEPPPASQCLTTGCNSAAAGNTPSLPEKKADDKAASAPARMDGGSAKSWSRTCMPSAPKAAPKPSKFRRMSSRSGVAMPKSGPISGEFACRPARVTCAKLKLE